MKRSISILLCCVLIFSSTCFAFADFGQTDSTNLSNIKTYVQFLYNNAATAQQITNIVSYLSNIVTHTFNSANRLQTIVTNTQNLNNNLVTLMGWLDPANGGSTSALLNQILDALVHTNAVGNVVSWLSDIFTPISTYLPDIYATLAQVRSINAKYTDEFAWLGSKSLNIGTVTNHNASDISSNVTNYYDGVINSLNGLHSYNTNFYNDMYSRVVGETLNRTSWTDLSNVTWQPYSLGNGLIRMLQYIQTPVARLSYVLASDERIAAQEAAAANEEAVVDNFIESTGNGSASTSDFTSISSASDGFKNNFNSGASAGGIWDVFNSDHGNWFSQSIADSLDTSGSGNRLLKSGPSFETPLLDQQIEDIYKSLGVMSND